MDDGPSRACGARVHSSSSQVAAVRHGEKPFSKPGSFLYHGTASGSKRPALPQARALGRAKAGSQGGGSVIASARKSTKARTFGARWRRSG